MYTIENDELSVLIDPQGAEINGLFNKKSQLEYLWDADPKFWPKHAPTLFPIVGGLKDGKYFFDNKPYELCRHGFTRDNMFTVKEQSPTSIRFELQDDETTLKLYPFHFSFSVIYTIEGSKLSVTYLVKNKGTDLMYFSVGGHPAFKLPIADELGFDDYYLLFNKTENAGQFPIDTDGLIENVSTPLLDNTNKLPLSKKLFYIDAIVLKDLQSDEVQLKSDKHPAGLSFTFKGFPYLGIWAAKDANFVCIEPWCGLGDVKGTTQVLNEKEGINKLAGGEDFERTWSVTTW